MNCWEICKWPPPIYSGQAWAKAAVCAKIWRNSIKAFLTFHVHKNATVGHPENIILCLLIVDSELTEESILVWRLLCDCVELWLSYCCCFCFLGWKEVQYNAVFKSQIYCKYDTMENKGLKRAMTDLDCTQGLFKFYHASYCGAKQCCLKAIIRWQQGKQHVQEDRKWEGSQGNTRGEALFLDPLQRLSVRRWLKDNHSALPVWPE